MDRRWLLLALAALPGCTLIDQRTFDPKAGMPPEIPHPPQAQAEPAPLPGPPPLLAIKLPAGPELGSAVAKAVAAARARKPDVVFDVVEQSPGAGKGVGAAAAEVARIIAGQGVPAARVRLAVRPAPDTTREVRVYVR